MLDNDTHHHHEEHCCCGHNHGEHHHEDGCCGHNHGEHHHEDGCCCGHSHGEHHHEDGCCSGHVHNHRDHDSAPDHGHDTVSRDTRVYLLENLGCANCAAKMEAKIQALPGVSSATITFATRQLRLTAHKPDALLNQIREICTSIEPQVVVKELTREPKEKHDHAHNREGIEIAIGAGLFVLGLLVHSMGLPEGISLLVFAVGYLILGGRILLTAFQNLKNGHVFDENFLMSLATLGAFAIREYPEAIGVMLFYRVGEFFEHRAVERSRSQIMEAVDLRPEVVNRIADSTVQVIGAEDAKVGDLLLIRPGDRIPLDGTIAEGESRLDTSPITGESVPVAVRAGDSVLSGCVNQSGQLKLRVDKPLGESMVSRILNSVENAAASKPKIDRFITRFARIYTPVVVLAAALTALIPSLVTGNWNYWVYTALSFLVMSCPCALVLSVPLAFFSGIGAGSRRGILFKGGVSMEALGKLKAVVLDKTGTITQGDFKLQEIVSQGSYGEEELLSLCAMCERSSTHPIAVSILTAAGERNVRVQAPDTMEEIPGQGIVARAGEKTLLCGNAKLMEHYGVTLGDVDKLHGVEVYVAVDGRLEGWLRISDTIKSDASSGIGRLKAMGLHTAMLTGDAEDSAKAVGAATGIDEVYARLLPQDKLAVLQQIRSRHGAVMFVGDGINDAPVLAGADVGAAMGSGADAAIEAADAVFMTSAVDSIPEAVEIARATNRIAVQNVVFALAVKLVVMILALCGFANMWLAVFADSGVAMLCVLNSIRILYRK